MVRPKINTTKNLNSVKHSKIVILHKHLGVVSWVYSTKLILEYTIVKTTIIYYGIDKV